MTNVSICANKHSHLYGYDSDTQAQNGLREQNTKARRNRSIAYTGRPLQFEHLNEDDQMYQTLYIDLPVASRETYRGVIASMTHYGFQVPQAQARVTAGRMRVTVLAKHCTGDVAGAAGEFVCTLPQGSAIEVGHANPFH